MNLAISFLTAVAAQAVAGGSLSAGSAPNPAEIFRDVCLQGGASFGPDRLVPVEVRDLPGSLRSGLGYFDSRAPRAQRFDAPGSGIRFFRIAPFDAYLMTADVDSGPCAVFWDGGHWREVREALAGWIAVPPTSILRTRGGDVWMETDMDSHALAVANYQGWVMLRAEALDRLKPREDAN